MPEIEGQKFPPYEFVEFPKVLYLDGDISQTRTVQDADEQAAALKDGFKPLQHAETGEEVFRAPPGAPEPAQEADADRDGHDDATGKFVAPQPPSKRDKK